MVSLPYRESGNIPAPLAIRSQRVGGVLFCDAGDAAPSLDALNIRVDVGLGVPIRFSPCSVQTMADSLAAKPDAIVFGKGSDGQ